MEYLLLPKPQQVTWQRGSLDIVIPLVFSLPPELLQLKEPVITGLHDTFMLGLEKETVCFRQEEELPDEGYRLQVSNKDISIFYGKPAGAFYALVTLRQLALQSGRIPCCQIRDYPELKIRGFMMDISRGKIPTLETLKKLTDLLAALKYNQLQLYIEGFSFDYPSFPCSQAGATPITPEEIRKLDSYCRQRFIELVPNQNCLGHMSDWLTLPQFQHLAEKEEGISAMGFSLPPTTLNPTEEDSIKLVECLTNDLLPNFTSHYYNVGLDEPFELGKGKNRELAESVGIGSLYLEYVKKIHKIVLANNRKMMMWGDIADRESQIVNQLPDDIMLLEWGYEAEHPFEARAKRLQQIGRRFCVCPGTTSWSSFTGMTDNMFENVTRAIKAAYNFGAEGMILTDWGDGGHLQYLPVSYPAIMLAGAMAWKKENVSEEMLANGLSCFVFMDKENQLGEAFLKAGKYSRFEEYRMPCRTLAAVTLLLGNLSGENFKELLTKITGLWIHMMPTEVGEVYAGYAENPQPLREKELYDYMKLVKAQAAEAHPACPEGSLIVRELQNGIRFVEILTQIRVLLVSGKKDSSIKIEIAEILEEHRRLWLSRNKSGRMEEGIMGFLKLGEVLSGTAVESS